LNFEFKNLKAELNNRTLTISWEGDSEDEIDSYFIEKSIDGINFEPIVQTYSKDVSTNSFGSKYITLSYDCSAFYWRLVIQKKDGEKVYSDVYRLQSATDCFTEFQAAFKDESELFIQLPTSLENETNGGFIIQLFDAQGRAINGQLLNNSGGLQIFKVANPLSKGLYILRYIQKNGMVFQKKILLN
jgi:hypothetical protein